MRNGLSSQVQRRTITCVRSFVVVLLYVSVVCLHVCHVD